MDDIHNLVSLAAVAAGGAGRTAVGLVIMMMDRCPVSSGGEHEASHCPFPGPGKSAEKKNLKYQNSEDEVQEVQEHEGQGDDCRGAR